LPLLTGEGVGENSLAAALTVLLNAAIRTYPLGGSRVRVRCMDVEEGQEKNLSPANDLLR
jgi:hypothetical protein